MIITQGYIYRDELRQHYSISFISLLIRDKINEHFIRTGELTDPDISQHRLRSAINNVGYQGYDFSLESNVKDEVTEHGRIYLRCSNEDNCIYYRVINPKGELIEDSIQFSELPPDVCRYLKDSNAITLKTLTNIKNEILLCINNRGYDICLIPEDMIINTGKVYLELNADHILYYVITPGDDLIDDRITLGELSAETRELLMDSGGTLEIFEQIKEEILEITTDRGHTHHRWEIQTKASRDLEVVAGYNNPNKDYLPVVGFNAEEGVVLMHYENSELADNIINIAKEKSPEYKKRYNGKNRYGEKILHIVDLTNPEPDDVLQNSTVLSMVGSPTTASGNIHNELEMQIRQIIDADDNPAKYSLFLGHISTRNYSKALHITSASEKAIATELLQKLLDYKDVLHINIDEPAGKNNRTAAHHAAMRGHVDKYRILVEAGANVELPDASGKSPEDYAIKKKIVERSCSLS